MDSDALTESTHLLSRKEVPRWGRKPFVMALAALLAVSATAFATVTLLDRGTGHAQLELRKKDPEEDAPHRKRERPRVHPHHAGSVYVVPRGPMGGLAKSPWKARFVPGALDPNSSAVAYFVDGEHQGDTGWGELFINATKPAVTWPEAERQFYAMGYAEGALTHTLINEVFDSMHYQWFQEWFQHFSDRGAEPNTGWETPLNWFLSAHMQWLRGMASAQTGCGPGIDQAEDFAYWAHVRMLIAQFDGLCAGYQEHASHKGRLTSTQLLMLQLDGDLETLISGLSPSKPLDVFRAFGGGKVVGADTAGDSSLWVEGKAPPQDQEQQSEQQGQGPMKTGVEPGTWWQHLPEWTEQPGADNVHAYKARRIHHRQENEELPPWVLKSFRCSALVRVASDNSDLFMGHDTWDSFASMLRVYKRMTAWIPTGQPAETCFPLPRSPALPPQGQSKQVSISFSSSPGFLSSVDDFYITSNGLTILETTNEFYNSTLYNSITPTGAVFSWMRNMVANYMATTGQEWTDVFAMFNSGTYNDQWMVIDNNLFSPGQPLPDGLLTVLEQLPAMVHTEDVTHVLRNKGYWGSYNVPYFQDIFNVSGFNKMLAEFGPDQYDHDECIRAKIFARDAPKIETLEQFQSMMLYNDWENDPLSKGDPSNGIMSRFDLTGKMKQKGAAPIALGGIDSKVTSWKRALRLEAVAINGPTHDMQPVFEWQDDDDTIHSGQPRRFDFDWVTMPFSFPGAH